MKPWSIVKMILIGANGAALALAQSDAVHAGFWHGMGALIAAGLATVVMATGAKDPAATSSGASS